jgi:hypothetical protein
MVQPDLLAVNETADLKLHINEPEGWKREHVHPEHVCMYDQQSIPMSLTNLSDVEHLSEVGVGSHA